MNNKLKIALLVITAFTLQYSRPAEAGIGDKIAGSTIKTVVKFVVATTNIEKTKKKIVKQLRETDNKTYRLKYTEFYELIKDLPEDIKAKYKVTSQMSKEQMMINVKSVDKKEVYRIINRMPDRTVIDLFKVYLGIKKKGARNVHIS